MTASTPQAESGTTRIDAILDPQNHAYEASGLPGDAMNALMAAYSHVNSIGVGISGGSFVEQVAASPSVGKGSSRGPGIA